MDQTEDSRELERKIAQANRIASSVSDQTTVGRLLAWAEVYVASSNSIARLRGGKMNQKARARVVGAKWPAFGRDLTFWLQAENQLTARNRKKSP
jgi:hypothetical protein